MGLVSTPLGAFLRGAAVWRARRTNVHNLFEVAFLDEEDALPVDEAPRPQQRSSRPPRTPRQQIVIRRLIAVGAGLLFIFIIVLGFKSCVQARKERAITNFVTDVDALMGESSQVGQDFFALLSDPSGRDVTEFSAQVKSYRGASETLYDRGKALDAPGEMSNAKDAIVITLQMRRDGLTAISDQIDTALGKENAAEAQMQIADQIKVLSASDSVYSSVALPEIQDVVNKEGVSDVPTLGPGNFVPAPPEKWLDPRTVTDALSAVSGTDTTTPGLHGLELLKTSVGDTQLIPDTPVTVSSSTPVLNVEVQNGGDSEETDISITVTIGGSTLNATIPTIGAGDTATAKVPITPVPASGEQTTVEVNVEPVPGETLSDNNSSTYTVTFQ
ncbi:MAG: CARDB domain-containing protein [Solirubrobacterales bacterium]